MERQRLAETAVPEEMPADDEWVCVIAEGESAIFITTESTREVVVLECRYTPQGLMYRLQHDSAA